MTIHQQFIGTCQRLSAADIKAIAQHLSVDVASVKAVHEVEARGRGYNKDCSPVMLYEYHIAWKYANKRNRERLLKANLARKGWGQLRYPGSHVARYKQLEDAIRICGEKAYLFASYGLGQIMGFNYKAAGHASPKALFEACKRSEYEQLLAMANFIMAHPRMHKALKLRQWATFARAYNGPGYKKNRYHIKLAAAYKRHAGGRGVSKAVHPVKNNLLDRGDKGPEVKELQKKINRLRGDRILVDGDFGQMTEQAVRALQKRWGLKQDGVVGRKTMAKINKALGE